MRVAVTRLGGNITNKNKDLVGNKETLSIAKVLSEVDEVDVLTCFECDGCISVDEDFDINQYDAVLVVNDSVNMFGGLEIKSMTTIFKLLHKFDKQIYYALTDLSLPFVDYYKLISGKPWCTYTEDDFKLKRPIVVLSQAYNLDITKKIHKNVEVADYVYVPFEEWIINLDSTPVGQTNRPIDLIYGGSFRSGRREKKFVDYFFNRPSMNITIYGNMKLSQFKDAKSFEVVPEFLGKVPNYEVVGMNSRSIATILMGDKNYNNNIVTLRYYEALLSGTVCFIDEDFDTNHILMPMCDYFYVKNGDELEEKIASIKSDIDRYKLLLDYQKQKISSVLDNRLSKKIHTAMFK